MTQYRASVATTGNPRRVGPYRLERLVFTDSDGHTGTGWRAWSGDFDFGTGHRGSLAGTLIAHRKHMRSHRKWMRARGLDMHGFPLSR